MDLRSIVNAEDAPDSRRSAAQSSPQEDRQALPTAQPPRSKRVESRNQTPLDTGPQDSRPAFPPPIQTSSHGDHPIHNASVPASVRYQAYPAQRRKDPSRPSRSQIFCEKLSQSHVAKFDPAGHPYYEGGSATSSQGYPSLGQSTPLTYTPTGSSPGSASVHSSFQRPTSSHSIQTPSNSQYPSSSFVQRSPQLSTIQNRPPSQPSMPQYLSQPHTPLGPPPVGRSSHHISCDSPVRSVHHRSPSGGSYSQPPRFESPSSVTQSPLAHSSRQPELEKRSSHVARSREKSISVSPKTRVTSSPVAGVSYKIHPYAPYTGVESSSALKRNVSDILPEDLRVEELARSPSIRRSASALTIDGLLNETSSSDRTGKSGEKAQSTQPTSAITTTATAGIINEPKTPRSTQVPYQTHLNSTPSASSHHALTSASSTSFESGLSSNMNPGAKNRALEQTARPSQDASHSQVTESGGPASGTHSVPDKSGLHPQESTLPTTMNQPAKKRQRIEAASPKPIEHELATMATGQGKITNDMSTPGASQVQKSKPMRRPMPIFAQSILYADQATPRNSSLTARIPSKLPPSISVKSGSIGPTAAPTSSQASVKDGANGYSDSKSNPLAGSHDMDSPAQWEESITNITPMDDMVKIVMDFLFFEVVSKTAVGVGPAGGLATNGAVLEVEAKFGRLIDQNTNDRLRIPVMSECVVSQHDPNLRISFESSMTEAQHRSLNQYLNKAVATSQRKTVPAKPRIPLSYKHTRETDTFYELNQRGMDALPPAITSLADPRHRRKTRVRMTTDQKTGLPIARIVKCRVADINIHSPRTPFDYRISVNVEMNFDGNMDDLVESDRQKGTQDRNKDRMSYTHLAYQIDLTQVTSTRSQSAAAEKEHELEIEISSEEIRRQGLLAANGQPNYYEQLVRVFLNNIREIGRQCSH